MVCRRGRFPSAASVGLAAVATVAFVLPLTYLAWTAATALVVPALPGRYGWGLLGRTLLYSSSAGLLAVAMGAVVARVIGRQQQGDACGRGAWELSRRLLLACVPATLVIPSLVYAYGGQQALRLVGWMPDPGSAADVLRCVVTVAAWLWGVPAAVVALAWNRLDPWTLQQAVLDGAYRRVTLRLLAGPMLAAWCLTTALATQEFAVFETTGIPVAATEMRVVFETGAFLGADAPAATQSQRAAAAIVTGLPSLLATLGLFGAALLWAWRLVVPPSADDAAGGTVPPAGHATQGPLAAHAFAYLVVAATLAVPVAALVLSLRDPAPPWQWLATFRPQVGGTLLMGALGCLAGAAIVLLGSVARPWTALGLGLATFLVGGLFVGIALVRLYNRPWTFWVYDTPLVTVLGYVARYGWVALLTSAAVAHGPSARRLREMAAVDGAGPWATLTRVVLPTMWPAAVAASLGVGVLSLGEVPTTMLVAPPSPPLLTPLLLSWVHMQRYDPMIQACLLLVGVCLAVAVPLTLGLLTVTRSTSRRSRGRRPPAGSW
ncbi:MAG: hypothetical protein ACK4PI_09835 [Tepidisphaerales bacterium]